MPYFFVAALLAAIVYGLLPKPTPVDVARVTLGPLTTVVLEEGKTRVRHRHIISPPVAGFLNRISLRAGDRVLAGETVLATIQPQPANFLDPRTRAEAEARVRGSEALKMQRETQIERARTALELATRELGRAQDLKRSGAIAQRELDTAERK